ncbi:PREDICTED: phytosulfokine receptor 2-like [Ipomoea nil]|uniref:phytosulfokine receptor 2-like n=1 Tax=Ipomoea nil TaxID=35883 RepID=UPI00090166BE|nr:PREDICTED: phytosulfokine receptor 2-like [Ipomoea nil]
MEPSLQCILVAFGGFFLFLILTFAVVYKCRKELARRRQPPGAAPAVTELSSVTVGESGTLNWIHMGELVRATRDFSPDLIIGNGGFGVVYRAKLSSGVHVAVKKLSPDTFQGFREFRAEMETLVKIQHENVVKILGYSAAGSNLVLIYEFVENGSLDQWLYDTSSSIRDVAVTRKPGEHLNWKTRIKIVQGVARGLAYLHSLDTPIIHRDIKASNILLDAEFKALITDFGFARLMGESRSHISTEVAGTMGYMPPAYKEGCTKATRLGDVYSFGVLMMEIVTGRQPNIPFRGEDGRDVKLNRWVFNMMSQKRYIETIDSNILRGDFSEKNVIKYFAIASRCLNMPPDTRPTMNDVIGMLEKAF